MTLYRAVRFFTAENGRSYTSYVGRNPMDTSFGPSSTTGTEFGDRKAVEKTMAWARDQGLEIIDNRKEA